MPSAVTVENDFSKGLITEATGLNFPEGACTETYDCEFDFVGGVRRRFGFDFERSYSTKAIDRTNVVVNSYLWKNVAGDGNVTVMVLQVGDTLYFYETNTTGNYSGGAVSSTVTLTPVSGASSTQVKLVEAQFCDGNGYLFVTHQYMDPIRVSYNATTHTASSSSITLQIRDFEGDLDDPETITSRPTSTLAGLNIHHAYNLYNQGWTTTNLTAWDTAQTTMPSNADVMWAFKDSSGNFDATSASIARITAGNTPAPKGHFILTLSNQDRSAVSGVAGITAVTTDIQRPSTAAFFAGRLFYAGVNYLGFNTKIYFSQLIERLDQYGMCYQVNDPSAEDLFDLLPSDGGVIAIPDAGTIYKLFTVPGGLVVFAHRGVWLITGSSSIGFTATDYVVIKISNIETLTASSFVNVQGYPAWWNAEGIYIMTDNADNTAPSPGSSGGRLPIVQSLTDHKIRDFYRAIPLSAKRLARGFYHNLDGHIRWVYRSNVVSDTVSLQYEFDRVLSFNTLTGAWYPWTISDSAVRVNGIISSDLLSRSVTSQDVIDGADNVLDGSDQVVAFTEAGTRDPYFDKYIVSYPDSGTYKFTFADKISSDFRDWTTYDNIGVDYTSYLITGYRIKGNAINKFRNNWVRIFSNLSDIGVDSTQYYFHSIWDYATTGTGTGRWSVRQLITHNDPNYSVKTARVKVRGQGIVLQFRIQSVSGQPFNIIGWSALQSANQIP